MAFLFNLFLKIYGRLGSRASTFIVKAGMGGAWHVGGKV